MGRSERQKRYRSLAMIISFGKTLHCLKSKTVTRRKVTREEFDQWLDAWNQGQILHDAYDYDPDKGGQKIGLFTMTLKPYWEVLRDMHRHHLTLEGRNG